MFARTRRLHAFDGTRAGHPGTVPIVAATVPLAVGAAMAYKMRKELHVAVAFFGDGTMEEGHRTNRSISPLFIVCLSCSSARTTFMRATCIWTSAG